MKPADGESGTRNLGINFYSLVIWTLGLVVPVFVLPQVVDNAFNTPKTLLLLLGVSAMTAVCAVRFLAGRPIPHPTTSVPGILLLLVLLNLFNFFYTENPYFTIVAASLNITCLLLFYFVSTRVNRNGLIILVALSALSGLLVSIETYLQFAGIFVLFKWAYEGMMVMGTIGNSNYLGAYLLFPLFCMLSLVFLLRGKWRLIPLALLLFMLAAFIFTRARAGWVGFFLALPLFFLLLKKVYEIELGAWIRSHGRSLIAGAFVLIALLTTFWYAAPDRLHSMMKFQNVTKSDTLRLRVAKYYPASFQLFKQSPLFGTGLWSYRSLVYEAQAEINQRTGDFFKDYPEPKPRRVHTEYLEILNDGGLVAAAALLLFLVVVMRHGWMVIRDDRVDRRERVLASTSFSALVGILLASFFFFSFRINSTLFMTVLMMGTLESLYLRNTGNIRMVSIPRHSANKAMIPIVVLVLVGLVWYTGIRPFKGERAHYAYKEALRKGQPQEAEKHLLRALELDPHNSAYCLYAAQLYINAIRNFVKANEFIERSIIDYNGDITRWAVYYLKGILKFQSGSLFEARAAFEKALYYNPEFDVARQKLKEVNQVIKDHDRVMIKFR